MPFGTRCYAIAAPRLDAALLESLNIADHPNVYEHHIHFTRSMTASSQQVQRSIYDSANTAWKEHKEKLKNKLDL